MKFGDVPISQAAGTILAHSIPLPSGRMRKGRVLTSDDIAALATAGYANVTVAQLESGDLHEDLAATQLAQALVPDPEAAGVNLGTATTGRVNIHAQGPGGVELGGERITHANAVHPMITVATLPPWQRVARGTMVATVKIISYGVAATDLQRAALAGAQSLCVRPPQRRRVTLIETTVGDAVGEKGARVTSERLTRLDAHLVAHEVAAHETGPLAAAILSATQTSDLILILTASATSDPMDTAPAALMVAGGSVTHFGMPVDPGNLLFFGALGVTPVIGLPGCARSPALNGADWVLERLICGVPLGAADIMAMGVGGLLKEIPTRPRPRDPR